MFEVISKIQNKTALFVKAQRERIGLEQKKEGRDLTWLAEGILGTEEETGMNLSRSSISQNKRAG